MGALGVWLIRTSPARAARRTTGAGSPEPVIP
jgi:hypothetical protein